MKKLAFITSSIAFLGLQAQDISHQALIDIIDSYRKTELKEVESKIQTLLVNKDYWLSVLRDQDVQYGYYENMEFIFVSNKSIPDLSLYQFNDGVVSQIGSSNALVGSGKGNKKVSGDLTTPIGVYDLKNKLTKLDQYYGAMAFVTSYPNAYDKSLQKTGYGIWIHGMPLNGNRDEKNTKGCIAIENEIITQYDKRIRFDNTILITYEDNYIQPTKDDIANLLAQLYLWKDTWEKGDFDNYIAFYSPDFKKPNKTNYKQYKRYKQRIFDKNEKKKIKFSQIDIVPYPNEEGKKLFRITFNQEYTAFDKKNKPSYRSNGRKELYVNLLEDGSMSILLEE
ncbi:L,D-transpeptidase Cds6 family protein [Helicobacter pametensis]|uniref:L,D-transpeptidase Cds6 family protein n=1 Tax=Helicobacter pametensis TaxID=95149 RepID=UPI00048896A2|nr:L,D-transpeptidase family protein [Helicobacter pametensis]